MELSALVLFARSGEDWSCGGVIYPEDIVARVE